MKITKINIICRKTKNYQAYEVQQEVTIEDFEQDKRNEIIRILQAECRRHCEDQIKLDENKDDKWGTK